MKTNWNATIKSAKAVRKSVKSTQQVSDLLKDFPPEGYMRDNISKNLVAIKECKSSSLRRYTKLLNNYYYTVVTEKDKKMILDKKIEIEQELLTRPDASVEEEKELKKKLKIQKAREKHKKELEKQKKAEEKAKKKGLK